MFIEAFLFLFVFVYSEALSEGSCLSTEDGNGIRSHNRYYPPAGLFRENQK